MAMRLQRKRPDGSPMFQRPHPGLARGKVRHVGDPLAMVVAEATAQAKDAAELVAVDYQELPSVTDTAAAAAPGAPAVWDECPDNICNVNLSSSKPATRPRPTPPSPAPPMSSSAAT